MLQWRRTGDVPALAEAAARMEPYWRRSLLDILPSGLRNDVTCLLRKTPSRVGAQERLAA
jgi:hypothetical protein